MRSIIKTNEDVEEYLVSALDLAYIDDLLVGSLTLDVVSDTTIVEPKLAQITTNLTYVL